MNSVTKAALFSTASASDTLAPRVSLAAFRLAAAVALASWLLPRFPLMPAAAHAMALRSVRHAFTMS